MFVGLVIGSILLQLAVFYVLWSQIRQTSADSSRTASAEAARLTEAWDRLDRNTRDEIARNRMELAEALSRTSATMSAALGTLTQAQKSELDGLSGRLAQLLDANERRLESLRLTLEERLRLLSQENAQKLEQMRQTVDEKLQSTLEIRLGESFKLVSDRLEMVHRGLGEMQTLAIGVGDLKKVLSNVKTRGTLAEVQLGTLLEQMLPCEQVAQNVETRAGSNQRVEFAIKLPGRDGPSGVFLPIDAKFPMEDYQRLVEAYEQGETGPAEGAGRRLEDTIKASAKKIRDSYLDPPATTDFAIMYLGTEGLYAEVLRRTGLFELLQRDFRVIPAGPTTLSAILNSLQMGFRTLAIQKRASEVWGVLGEVRNEFAKFADLLDSVQEKLNQAQTKIEAVTRKSRTIERKLLGIESSAPSASQEGQPQLELS